MNQQLIEELCAIIERQNDLIKKMATRLNERDDVDLAEEAAAVQEKYNQTIGTETSEGGAA